MIMIERAVGAVLGIAVVAGLAWIAGASELWAVVR